MKIIILVIITLSGCSLFASSIDDLANKIDSEITVSMEGNFLNLNEIVEDEVFVRRVYLDVIGRIPTKDEYMRFIVDKSPLKRTKLANSLLNSEGYNSSIYHFYADLLRLRVTRQSGLGYVNWVKKEIAANTPWDVFVKKLILARGNISTAPEAGFYLRDRGMPFSHMSNTIQAFLGTRLQCAQCHDHPFDKWTQKNFFELSAFTYPVYFKGGSKEYNKSVDIEALRKEGLKLGGPPLQVLRRNIDYGAFVTDQRNLQFPHDYQYDDAKPNSKVTPTIPDLPTEQNKAGNNSGKLKKFANWLSSPENELFTKIMANRLWKKYMGQGVFEPVDNFSSKTVISNKSLMSLLEKALIDCEYDLKKFQSVILRTKAYQRSSESLGEQNFNGPLIKRMTAEQVWDSFGALLIENIDSRPVSNYPQLRQFYMNAFDVARSRELTKMSQEKYQETIAEANRRYTRYSQEDAKLRKRITASPDKLDKKKLLQEAHELKKNLFLGISEMVIGEKLRSVQDKLNSEYIVKTISSKLKLDYVDISHESSFWKTYRNDMVRASKAGFPVKDSHFLRVFGSSDYNVLGGSSQISTVTQSLYMLNGLNHFNGNGGYLGSLLKACKTSEEQINTAFISILSRPAKANEIEACKKVLELDSRNGIRTIVKSLLNTKTFLFY